MKSGFCEDSYSEYFVTKVASCHPSNVDLGLSTSSGVMMLFSQRTGKLVSILLDDGYLTDLRTAAAGALVLKSFGPVEITSIGVLGTGVQARFQLDLVRHVTRCRNVVIYGRSQIKLDAIRSDVERFGYSVSTTTNPVDVAAQCNVIIATTSAKEALLRATDICQGTLILAFGADGGEKQELDPEIFSSMDGKLALLCFHFSSRRSFFNLLFLVNAFSFHAVSPRLCQQF